ncbi:hypothetical protein FRC14_002125 [Serendipita sp. 396]|nr:hypothetical protein FRC14_002125 [Serendipita sp. 396]
MTGIISTGKGLLRMLNRRIAILYVIANTAAKAFQNSISTSRIRLTTRGGNSAEGFDVHRAYVLTPSISSFQR